MRKLHIFATFLALCEPVFASGAWAAPRTFVSLGGDDGAVCANTAPCRSFSGAYAKTDAGGEIVVLDSAGYGPLVATKSITISAPSGVYAGVTVPSGGTGILVNGGGILVALKNVAISGGTASYGVRVTNGSARIENSSITGLAGTGISVESSGSLAVVDTVIESNSGYGISSGSTGTVDLLRVRVTNNASQPARSGIYISDGTAMISQCYIAGNVTAGNGAGLYATGSTVRITLDRSIVTRNGVSGGFHGIYLDGGAHIFATGNTISANGAGITNAGSTFLSAGDNAVRENGSNTSGTITNVGRL